MFFVTVKFNRRTAVKIILAAAAVLIALILIFSHDGSAAEETFKSQKLTDTESRIAYLRELGWEADAESETEKAVLIPREFPTVYEEYNKLQKQQGYDLRQYSGREVTMVSYLITNYSGSDDTVVAVLYLYDGAVIGGDIHSTKLNGFMHGLK